MHLPEAEVLYTPEMGFGLEASCAQNSTLSVGNCNEFFFPGNAACTLPEHNSNPWRKQVLQRAKGQPEGTHSTWRTLMSLRQVGAEEEVWQPGADHSKCTE